MVVVPLGKSTLVSSESPHRLRLGVLYDTHSHHSFSLVTISLSSSFASHTQRRRLAIIACDVFSFVSPCVQSPFFWHLGYTTISRCANVACLSFEYCSLGGGGKGSGVQGGAAPRRRIYSEYPPRSSFHGNPSCYVRNSP